MTRSRAGSRADQLTKALAKLVTPSTAGLHLALAGESTDADGGGTSAELWLYGVVGGYWYGFSAKTVADQLSGLDVDNITVRLHSPGGSIVDGIAISSLLRNHKAHVTVVVDGLAASSASLIAVAGDEVVMSPGSQMMLHDGWMVTVGNERELRQDADLIGKQSANMAEVYAYAAGGTAEAWRAVMTADPDGTWYTAAEAVKAGLADRVGTVTAAAAAPEPPTAEGFEDDEELAARAELDLGVLVSNAARAVWSYADRAPKPPTASADGSITTTQERRPAMAFTPEQLTTMRQELGLAEDADEATIVAALSEALSEQAEETTSTTAAAAPQVPEGMSLVDSAVLAQLQQGAEAGRTAAATLAEQERDVAFKAALTAGKITADTAKTLRAKVDEDPATWASTKALLDALTPGLVPTAEVGHEGEPSAIGAGIELDDAEVEAFAASIGLNKEALRG